MGDTLTVDEILRGAKVQLTADCGCGGKMIPHPRKPMIWICDRSHWWNRKRHSYLVEIPRFYPRRKEKPHA